MPPEQKPHAPQSLSWQHSAQYPPSPPGQQRRSSQQLPWVPGPSVTAQVSPESRQQVPSATHAPWQHSSPSVQALPHVPSTQISQSPGQSAFVQHSPHQLPPGVSQHVSPPQHDISESSQVSPITRQQVPMGEQTSSQHS